MKEHTVRVTYVVPADAEEWPGARERANELLIDLRQFFADEMARNGFNKKTFEIAYDQDEQIDFHKRDDIQLKKEDFWPGRKQALKACRDEIGPPDQHFAELCFIESYSISNGVVTGVTAGTSKRRSCLSSLYLKLTLRDRIAQETLSPEELESISTESLTRETFRWLGATWGEVIGSAYGAIAHELAHCFGADDHRAPCLEKKEVRKGHLMGRSPYRLQWYFGKDSIIDGSALCQADAAVLDESDFFDFRD